MEKPVRHVIKASDIKLEGQFRLDATQTSQGTREGKNVATTTPQVCIAENNPDFAVIEITCSCGTKTYVRCEYTAGQSPAENPQTQNHTPEIPDQEPDQQE